MTINDPEVRVTRVVGAAEPRTVIHTTEVRESSAAWWIGALVAIVAILAVVFLVTRSPDNANDDVSTALQLGHTQGALEATQSSLNEAQEAASRAAERASEATAEARDATARAAANAADATAAAADNAVEAVTPAPAG